MVVGPMVFLVVGPGSLAEGGLLFSCDGTRPLAHYR